MGSELKIENNVPYKIKKSDTVKVMVCSNAGIILPLNSFRKGHVVEIVNRFHLDCKIMVGVRDKKLLWTVKKYNDTCKIISSFYSWHVC